MESFYIFKDLAIILIFAKFFGLVAKKLKAPQVVGEIIAGLVIGPSMLGIVGQSDFLSLMAEIGVVLLMFTAGLETDLREMVKTGPIALFIACMGVAIPCVGGFLTYSCFFGFAPIGSLEFLKALFIGVIMTATSVSITVQTLRELGRLRGRVGTTLLSAAIIDDIIGIVVLTFVIGFKDPTMSPVRVIIQTVLFFVFAIVIGKVCYILFKKMDKRWKHHQRIAITGLALCFALAFIAEKFFGIADITGAYVAGIILCNIQDSDYIARKMDVNSYMVFGPIFFASIGLKTQLSGMTIPIALFSTAFVIVALITKIMGCSLAGKIAGFKGKDPIRIGVGMMTRGEVALIVSQKGLAVGLMSSVYFTPVIIMIMVSSIVTPIILKLLYRGEPEELVQS